MSNHLPVSLFSRYRALVSSISNTNKRTIRWKASGAFGVVGFCITAGLYIGSNSRAHCEQLNNDSTVESPVRNNGFPAVLCFNVKVRSNTGYDVSSSKSKSSNDDKCLAFTDFGFRTVTWFGIKVYAIGLYIDKEIVKKNIGCLPGKDALNKIATNTQNPIMLRMVFSRDVAWAHLIDGYVTGMRQQVQFSSKTNSNKNDEFVPDLTKEIEFLSSAIPSKQTMLKGTIIDFVRLNDRSTVVVLNGETKASTDSKIFTELFFQMYLGDDPKSVSARDNYTHAIEKMLCSAN